MMHSNNGHSSNGNGNTPMTKEELENHFEKIWGYELSPENEQEWENVIDWANGTPIEQFLDPIHVPEPEPQPKPPPKPKPQPKAHPNPIPIKKVVDNPKTDPPARFVIQTAMELAESDLPPVEWIIEDLLPKGLTMLSGDAKIGKSFFCLNIAFAIAHGGIALSRFEVPEAKTVAYLALEDVNRSIKSRLSMIQPDGDMPNNLGFIYEAPHILNEKGLVQIKEQLIDDFGAEVIIVDTRKHLVPITSKRGSSYDIDYEVQAPIHTFARDNNISLILVTHNTKSRNEHSPQNNMQGSMAIQGACDTMMNILKTDGMYSLNIIGREMPETDYPLEFNEGIWVAQTVEERMERQLSDTRNVILSLLKDAEDGLTVSEIVQMAETYHGLKEANVKNTLLRMKKAEQVDQPKPRGRYFYVTPVTF